MRWIIIPLLLACAIASGQVVVRVNDAAPLTLDAQKLTGLPRHAAILNDHGKQVSFEGVLLHDVLVLGGVDFSKGLHAKELSSYVLAIGADDYQVVYALADFDPSVTDSGIILADQRDGKPLDPKEGPLRVIVPGDKRPARSVRLLKEIDVVQLNK